MQNLVDLIKEKQQLKDITARFKSGGLGHAFLITGSDAATRSAFCSAAASLICGEHNFADKHVYNSFLTTDCADLIYKTNLKPIISPNKVFIIDAGQISTIVQNKILKTIEEPPANSFFFITGGSLSAFLPTVQSRCEKVVLDFLNKNDFDRLGLNELFKKSGGNITLALQLKEKTFIKKFEHVTECLEALSKSSQLIKFARSAVIKTRDDLSDVLNIYEIILSGLLKAKIANENFWNEKINKDISVSEAAMLIEEVLKAKRRNKANCSISAVYDEFLLKILEIKYYAKKVCS